MRWSASLAFLSAFLEANQYLLLLAPSGVVLDLPEGYLRFSSPSGRVKSQACVGP